MELVAAVGLGIVGVIALSVCVRRATLGAEMDRSLGRLKSQVPMLASSTIAEPSDPVRTSLTPVMFDALSAAESDHPRRGRVSVQVPLAS